MKRKNYYGVECAQRLDALMTERNIKAPALAELSHYSSQQIRNFLQFSKTNDDEAAYSIAPILGVRPEYLLCEDNCKSPEELEEFHKRKEMSHLLDMKITSDIAILTSTIVKNIETNNENSFISNSDYNEFRKDISDYIQMRTEKWLLPRLREKQSPET